MLAQLRGRITTSAEDEIETQFGWAEVELQRVLDDDEYEALSRERRVWSARAEP